MQAFTWDLQAKSPSDGNIWGVREDNGADSKSGHQRGLNPDARPFCVTPQQSAAPSATATATISDTMFGVPTAAGSHHYNSGASQQGHRHTPSHEQLLNLAAMLQVAPQMLGHGARNGQSAAGHESEEFIKIQQSQYKARMIPPPLTIQQHADIFARNRQEGNNNSNGNNANFYNFNNSNNRSQHQSSNSVDDYTVSSNFSETPADTHTRLGEYKAIIVRWCRVAATIAAKRSGGGVDPMMEAAGIPSSLESIVEEYNAKSNSSSDDDQSRLLSELSDSCEKWWNAMNARKEKVVNVDGGVYGTSQQVYSKSSNNNNNNNTFTVTGGGGPQESNSFYSSNSAFLLGNLNSSLLASGVNSHNSGNHANNTISEELMFEGDGLETAYVKRLIDDLDGF